MRKILLSVVVAGLAALWLLLDLIEGGDGYGVARAAVLGAFLLIGFLLLRNAGNWLSRWDIFSPAIAFPLLYVFWFALGFLATAIIRDDFDYQICIWTAAGLFCYFLGIRVFSRRWRGQPVHERSSENTWNRDSFWLVVSLLGCLTVAAYLYLISQMGIPALSSMAAERRLEITKYGPTQGVLFTAADTLIIFLCAHLSKTREKVWLRALSWVALGSAALFMLSLGSRGFLFGPVLTSVIAYHYLGEKVHGFRLLKIGIPVFVGLSVYGYVRDQISLQGTEDFVATQGIDRMTFSLFYVVGYITMSVTALYDLTRLIPTHFSYQYGTLTFAPLSTVLPGHHEMSDMIFKRMLGEYFVGGGQPATLLGPFYGDFGIPGILAGMFIVGLLMGSLYAWMSSRRTVFRVLIYSWVMHNTLLSLFGSFFPYLITLWIPLFWWFLDSVILTRTPFRLDSRQGDATLSARA